MFDSLIAQEALSTIGLIDNASTDDSVEFTQTHYPQVEVLQNRENLNFGTAYNRAVATRTEDVIFIVNNDIIVRPGAVRSALQFLEGHSDVASVSFEGLDPSRSEPFPSSCGPLRRFGKELSPARHFRGPNDSASESPCFLWGAAACIRRDVLAKVQFDEKMDWGCEDVDLAWSIRRQTGLTNVFLPGATVYHLESHTARKRFRARQIQRMVSRNTILSFAKNATALELTRAAPYIVFNFLRCPRRLELAQLVGQRLKARLQP